MYSIGAPEDNPETGPYSLRLTPDAKTKIFGRSGFLIHGPSKDPEHYGNESKGCIVISRNARVMITLSGIKRLIVE